MLAELIIRSAYLGSLLFFYPVSPWKLHLITPDTSVNIYWFLYWIIWIFGKFFFLFSFVIFCVAKLLVSLQPSNFFSLSSSTAHILVIVNLMPVNYREAEFTFVSNAEEEKRRCRLKYYILKNWGAYLGSLPWIWGKFCIFCLSNLILWLYNSVVDISNFLLGFMECDGT